MSFDAGQPSESHLIDLANRSVELAKQGDFQAGMEVIIQSRVVIRGWLEQGDAPDPYRFARCHR